MHRNTRSISKKALLSSLRVSDFHRDRVLGESLDKETLCEQALRWTLDDPMSSVGLAKREANGRSLLVHEYPYQELAMRLVGENIRRSSRLSFPSRDSITRALLSILKITSSYKIIRLDISDYYRSFNHDEAKSSLSRNASTLGHRTSAIAQEFLIHLSSLGEAGFPPGLPLSAVLAEYMMRDFDSQCSRQEQIHHYYRFVDDIIMLCSPSVDRESLVCTLNDFLPKGLAFNNSKQAVRVISKANKTEVGSSRVSQPFDYLGYCFDPSPSYTSQNYAPVMKVARAISVRIADNKIKKLKTRAALTLLDYQNNKDESLMRARMQCLTENFSFTDFRQSVHGLRRNSGVYFNYPLLTEPRSGGLESLDRFLKSILFGNHSSTSKRVKATIPVAIRRRLAGYSFLRGYETRRTKHYSPKELRRIVRVWKHAT